MTAINTNRHKIFGSPPKGQTLLIVKIRYVTKLYAKPSSWHVPQQLRHEASRPRTEKHATKSLKSSAELACRLIQD
eukprot:3935162-Rhodomonas_salina.2